ncbi:MAG: dihydrolipoyl dehydrogenase [Sedimentibacter sp.]
MYDYDVVCIGAGSGGCACAIRLADLGEKVALVEKRKNGTGGTCVNRGCIPTKVLVRSAEVFKEIQSAKNYGIEVENAKINLATINKNINTTIKNIRFGLDNMIIKPRNIARIEGQAILIDSHTIKITNSGEDKIATCKTIVLAMGSEPALIPAFNIDRENIITSDEALNIENLPKSIVIVGAGALGLEFGYVYSTFGCDVTIVEMMDHVIPIMNDKEVTDQVEKTLKKSGLKIKTGCSIEKVEVMEPGTVKCSLENGEEIIAEKVLVAIGRSLNTKNMNLEELGIKLTKNNLVEINEHMQTSIDNIFAVGDITVGPQLSHKAQKQGLIAAEYIAGDRSLMNATVIPWAIFIHPEIAAVGITENDAKTKGIDVIVGKLSFNINEKAMAMQKTTGIIKIVAEKNSHKILGAQIFGEDASVLISEITTTMDHNGTIEEIANCIHAHPALSEIVMETAKNALGKSFHK